MIEFVVVYWALRDRWSVYFSNGATLTGARTQAEAEGAALDVLGVQREAFEVNEHEEAESAVPHLVRFRPRSWRVQVRDLEEDERARIRECLEWMQFCGIRNGEPSDFDEESTRQRYALRVEQARERWPDVARLIGF
jgi:hypothetical protein